MSHRIRCFLCILAVTKLQGIIGSIGNEGVDKRGWRDARKTPFFTLIFSGLFGMLQKAEPDKCFFVPQNDSFPHKKRDAAMRRLPHQ